MLPINTRTYFLKSNLSSSMLIIATFYSLLIARWEKSVLIFFSNVRNPRFGD